MDEQAVRQAAEAHGQANVEGDLRRAGSDLTPEAMAGVKPVMAVMPKPLNGAHIEDVQQNGDEFVVRIRYTGPDGAATIASHWADRDGAPKITKLEVV